MQKTQQPLGLPVDGIAPSSKTAPGPPVPFRGVSANPSFAKDAEHPSNPFQVDLVIPFNISLAKGDRARAQTEVRDGYERLLRALEGEGGLRVASRPGRAGRGQEEVWVFVGVSEEKLTELVEREACVLPMIYLDGAYLVACWINRTICRRTRTRTRPSTPRESASFFRS